MTDGKRRENMNLKMGSAVVAMAVAAVITSGCTSAQKGAAIGGVLGAGTGAIWANQTSASINSIEGAGIGLAAGGLVGALAGDALDEMNRENKLAERDAQIASLNTELTGKDNSLSDLRSEVERLKAELAKKPELVQQPEIKVDTVDGTIRFTILNEVLFDPGKAKLKDAGLSSVDSVLSVINAQYPDRKIIIEGHTDADPIKQSTWKSNWELSAGRSLAVVHYLIDVKKFNPAQLSAQAFGEFRPVAANDTAEGKLQNRRAVIVVMPPESKIIVDRQK